MADIQKMNLDGDRTDIIMGIDLGTTNSAVAVYTAGIVPVLCPMGVGGKTTLQSCVRWDGGDKFTVGPEAYAERYKPNVVYSVKRVMGSGSLVRFVRKSGNGNDEFIEMTPAQVSAKILEALAEKARESYPGLYRCIITVPAYFNQRQIEDTIEASKIAGLECVQILKEPTSASYIYSQMGYAKDGSILIYDLGGGTFDVTHMSFLRKSSIPPKMITSLKKQYGIDLKSISDDDSSLYYCRVLGTFGDVNLGGDDIDAELAKILIEKSGEEVSNGALEELKLRCEQFKKNNIEGIDVMVDGKKYSITRDDLQTATKVIFDRTLDILGQMDRSELAGVKTIVLVGGSTKSDYLLKLMCDTFPDKEISRVLDPDATVALGAGAVAKDLSCGKGAMYQDVLPMAIGILEGEDHIDFCVPKNTPMPYSVSRTYHTMHDNQKAISIDVYQGVSKDPADCAYLGRLRIDGLPDKPAGELEVTVYFMLSAQGRLKVTTVVDGISEQRELVIDSIFSVNNDTKVENAGGTVLNYDDFEKSIADLCVGNENLQQLVLMRRAAIEGGDTTTADEYEVKIMEAL